MTSQTMKQTRTISEISDHSHEINPKLRVPTLPLRELQLSRSPNEFDPAGSCQRAAPAGWQDSVALISCKTEWFANHLIISWRIINCINKKHDHERS